MKVILQFIISTLQPSETNAMAIRKHALNSVEMELIFLFKCTSEFFSHTTNKICYFVS